MPVPLFYETGDGSLSLFLWGDWRQRTVPGLLYAASILCIIFQEL